MAALAYCIITNRKLCRQPLHEIAHAAEEAGIDYFQLREKDLTPAQLLILAKHIRPMLVRTKFIVNGSLEVAVASGADGVHLQKENLPIVAVRKAFPELIIGYSAHEVRELQAVEAAGATYVFVSPVFPPRSKQAWGSTIGVKGLRGFVERTSLPVFALGGIRRSNLREVAAAHCAGVAGISLFLKDGYFTAQEVSK